MLLRGYRNWFDIEKIEFNNEWENRYFEEYKKNITTLSGAVRWTWIVSNICEDYRIEPRNFKKLLEKYGYKYEGTRNIEYDPRNETNSIENEIRMYITNRCIFEFLENNLKLIIKREEEEKIKLQIQEENRKKLEKQQKLAQEVETCGWNVYLEKKYGCLERIKDRYRDGYTYIVISNASQHIKIGHSTNLKSRMQSLKTMTPEGIKLIGLFSATRISEEYLHRKFDEFRISPRTEWFNYNNEIVEYIKKTMNDTDKKTISYINKDYEIEWSALTEMCETCKNGDSCKSDELYQECLKNMHNINHKCKLLQKEIKI
jgi:hypothetical protein